MRLGLTLTIVATLVASSCTASEASELRSSAPRQAASVDAGRSASAAVEELGVDLYGKLAEKPGNLVLSPYSVAIALAMTRAGADGETARQMDAVLHAIGLPDLHGGLNALDQALAKRPGSYKVGDRTAQLELATANQLFGQMDYPFMPAFLDLLASRYGAGLRLVDYVGATEEARRQINRWVAQRTRDRIPELIARGVLDAMTRLVLTNAVYLKAAWVSPFNDSATAAAPFRRLDGTQTQAQLMTASADFPYAKGTGYQAIELPYAGGLSMLVLVPDEGRFAEIERAFGAAHLRAVVAEIKPAQVALRLPKFEFRTQAGLKETLIALGMPIAFTADADFTPMSPRGRELFIQDVVHEAFISVDEDGTEAAAATAVVIGRVSLPAVTLTVDRPFLFAIRDNETGALLFMGRVVDPT